MARTRVDVLTVGSLFAGIGGFDLGLERAGMRSVWQCEIDPYCQRVLAKHWPDVLRVPDVRDVGLGTVPDVDVICGGFPCQDISLAGKHAGINGERSGLWHEYARIVRELRPEYVVVENVTALIDRGLDVVLAALATAGFDAEWTSLRASDFGAPHARDRLWLVAYPASSDGSSRHLLEPSTDQRPPLAVGGLPSLPGAPGWRPRGFWGAAKPPSRLLDDGLSERVDGRDPRPPILGALGNSLVPQIAEWIGQRIVAYEERALTVA